MVDVPGPNQEKAKFYWHSAAEIAKKRLSGDPVLVKYLHYLDGTLPFAKSVDIAVNDALFDETKFKINGLQEQLSPSALGKIKEWLQGFAGTVLAYAPVIDVAVQHNPEFVSLAWAAIRFGLLVYMNSMWDSI